jgi:hypothetical protein
VRGKDHLGLSAFGRLPEYFLRLRLCRAICIDLLYIEVDKIRSLVGGGLLFLWHGQQGKKTQKMAQKNAEAFLYYCMEPNVRLQKGICEMRKITARAIESDIKSREGLECQKIGPNQYGDWSVWIKVISFNRIMEITTVDFYRESLARLSHCTSGINQDI